MRKLSLQELGRVDLSSYKSLPKIPVVVVLDNIRSAHNVGSFFRTCDALRISHLYLTGISAQPPHREITKTAIGATSSVDWSYKEDITEVLSQLKEEEHQIIGVEQTDTSVSLENFVTRVDQKYALVFGNEVQGVSSSALPLLDMAIEIPQFGTKHSFNVAVCAGIVLWEFAKPYVKSKRYDL